ncbi:MAG: hypothetical protein D6693_06050 [Planctomycetota bacterium]|nr:MAG: hypothetical protein D6693_06050 [Planctomycetota bacterium]
MQHRRSRATGAALLTTAAAIAGAGHAAGVSPAPITVAVSVPSLESLVAPALPPSAQIEALPRTPGDVHGAELSPSTVLTALTADVLVYTSDRAEPAMARLADRRRALGAPSVAFVDDHGEPSHAHDHAALGAGAEHPWLDPALVASRWPVFASELARAAGVTDPAAGPSSAVRDAREVEGAYRVAAADLAGWSLVSVHGAADAALRDAGFTVLAPMSRGHGVGVTPSAIARLATAADRTGGRVILLIDASLPAGLAGRLERRFGVRLAFINTASGRDWERLMRENLRSVLAAALAPGSR